MNQDTPPELEVFRQQIDECDQELIDVLARRFNVVRQVGAFKVGAQMEAIQSAREQAVKDRAVRLGQELGLDSDFIRRLYEVMIDYAHDIEHEILAQDAQDKGE
ncbi:MAG TPA: chorismate mutase [Alphaproteobacteria bacterium]|nr:chorismate mutase [Alphaproteobacteria bacterium]USO05390.1 MAG: chorismate mutase [Rhodospirillales bacterium]HOO81294.1 chorismate mutase [Alphaproteobacteria bacterium]